MAGEHDKQGGPRYCALYEGTVVDNADPRKLGRCRVRIPGLVEPASAWALPVGGGGGPGRRGTVRVPPKGASVAVFFHAGDPDHPHYLQGHYAAPNGASEVPGPLGGYRGGDDPAGDIADGDAHRVPAFEGERYVAFVDERPGHERMVLRDKRTNDEIEFDGVAFGITIKATTAVRIEAIGQVDIRAAAITLNGRPVMPGGGAI